MKDYGAATDDAGKPSEAGQNLFGYIGERFMMNQSELARSRQLLVDYAKANGWNLTAIFIERVETAPSAFEAMARKLAKVAAPVFVIPGPRHLSILGHPQITKLRLQRLGARVLVARQAF